jgi:hypothetical protein
LAYEFVGPDVQILLNIAVSISSLCLSGDAGQSTPTDQISYINAGCSESIDRRGYRKAKRVLAGVLI